MTEIKNRKSLSQGTTYFDDYEKTNYWKNKAKYYQSILFRAGKPLQSRELNFLQSIVHNNLKNSNDVGFRNGSIVEGCGVNFELKREVNGDSSTYFILIKVGDGIVYWDGTFFDFSEKTIDLIDNDENKTAEWISSQVYPLYVYLATKYETITAQNDPELNDPAIVYKVNKKISGADRLKITFDVICSTNSDIYGKDGTINQWIPIAIISSKDSITLINRNARLDFDDRILESKVLNGLRIKNNPMREAFMITEDNKDYYRQNDDGTGKEYSFVEIEAGNCIINGEKVSSMESKVLNFDKALSTEDNLKSIEETHNFDVGKDLKGCFWADIAHPTENDPTFDLLYDGFLNKGQKVKIRMRVPIYIGENENNEPIFQYVLFDVGEAEIADVYNLQNDEEYNTDIEENTGTIGTIPIFDIERINVPTLEKNFVSSFDFGNKMVNNGIINSSFNISNEGKIDNTATEPLKN